jgi:hypothetical protein
VKRSFGFNGFGLGWVLAADACSFDGAVVELPTLPALPDWHGLPFRSTPRPLEKFANLQRI